MMTYLEKLKLDHPTLFDPNKFVLNVVGTFCPWHFNLKEHFDCIDSDSMDCEKCWNREYPLKEIEEAEKDV